MIKIIHVGKIGILLLVIFQLSHAQVKQSSISLILGGYYCNPDLNEINAVYRSIEHAYSLPKGDEFKNYYSVIAGISFNPVPQHGVQLEVGGSIYRTSASGSPGGNMSASFLNIYYIGGTYLFHLPIGHRVGLILGGGPGYVWVNSERTYAVESGTAIVNGQLGQLHAVGGLKFLLPKDVSLDIEAGYSYATMLSPNRADIDFTLQSPTYGIIINIPLFKF